MCSFETLVECTACLNYACAPPDYARVHSSVYTLNAEMCLTMQLTISSSYGKVTHVHELLCQQYSVCTACMLVYIIATGN